MENQPAGCKHPASVPPTRIRNAATRSCAAHRTRFPHRREAETHLSKATALRIEKSWPAIVKSQPSRQSCICSVRYDTSRLDTNRNGAKTNLAAQSATRWMSELPTTSLPVASSDVICFRRPGGSKCLDSQGHGFGQRNSVLLCQPGRIVVFGRESREPSGRYAILPATRPKRVCTSCGSRRQHGSLHRRSPHAECRRFLEQNRFQPIGIRWPRLHADQNSGPILLHLNRRQRHIKRAGLPQSLDRMADRLAAGVVEIGFQQDDRFELQSGWRRGRAVEAASPTRIRSKFGCGKSFCPAP